MPANRRIQRALISVSDKTGIVELAKALTQFNIQIISTGGTAKLLQQHQIPVTEVSSYTGFPEIMDGRVKTLHPKIHGGLLARRGLDDEVLQQHHINTIDLLVVNLYPFTETIHKPNCSLELAIENIDIGGPTMLRAAAKNYKDVTVVVDNADYQTVIDEMQQQQQSTTEATRFQLAKKVFTHTAHYDAAIATYLSSLDQHGKQQQFPDVHIMQYVKKQNMRYGENPHQQAALYIEANTADKLTSVAHSQQLQGKALSFNNIADTDAALECVKCFHPQPACVIVKHANPCGVATADNQLNAYLRAFATDPVSSFGGIIAFNSTLAEDTAAKIVANQFAEVIIAPDISSAALKQLSTKPNIRVLTCGQWPTEPFTALDYKRVTGGLLVQDRDIHLLQSSDLTIASQRKPSEQELNDLLFAWKVAKFVKSNAIVYAKDQATIAIGAGQMSRIDSAKIAVIKAESQQLSIPGSVMASDAFFPFRDGIDAAAAAGITAVIQPGGSIRDQEVIQAANEANMAMVFTGIRHFRH